MATGCAWMEIRDLSNSLTADAVKYARTRLIRMRIALLWLLLVAATVISAAAVPPPIVLAQQAGFLLVAIVVFRLWDDLADRAYDRRHHPERVLASISKPWPFVLAELLGLVLLLVMLRHDLARLAVLLLYVALMSEIYHGKYGRLVIRPLRVGLVLAKYPLFVFLLVSPSIRAWLAGIGLLAILGIYEWRSDAGLREAPPLQLIAAAASAAAIVSALYLSFGVMI